MGDILRITLAAARVNAGLTQEQAAEAINISKVTLASWEKYKTIPSLEKARQLSDLYKIPLDNIFLP